jgi:hypothetical protein
MARSKTSEVRRARHGPFMVFVGETVKCIERGTVRDESSCKQEVVKLKSEDSMVVFRRRVA